MNKEFIGGMGCGAITLFVFCTLIGATPFDARCRMEKEAIDKGHASYVLNTNKFPPTIMFQWK